MKLVEAGRAVHSHEFTQHVTLLFPSLLLIIRPQSRLLTHAYPTESAHEAARMLDVYGDRRSRAECRAPSAELQAGWRVLESAYVTSKHQRLEPVHGHQHHVAPTELRCTAGPGASGEEERCGEHGVMRTVWGIPKGAVVGALAGRWGGVGSGRLDLADWIWQMGRRWSWGGAIRERRARYLLGKVPALPGKHRSEAGEGRPATAHHIGLRHVHHAA